MTELTGTFDISNNPELLKLFEDQQKTIHDIQVIELCDKGTGEKYKFVSIDRVLAVLDIESRYICSMYAYGENIPCQEFVRRFSIIERVFEELKEGE